MLAKMIDKIVSLKETKTFEIQGETYSDNLLYLVEKKRVSPSVVVVSGLDAICKLIQKELNEFTSDVTFFIEAAEHNNVKVFTSYLNELTRFYLYEANADAPGLKSGWRDIDNALIELRSLCVPGDGVNKLLTVFSSVSFDEGMEISDNGMTQSVKVKSGVSLNQMARVEPRVTLQPFRTFLEIDQPSSEFVVRVDKNKGVGLFEADGGIWKLEAKRNIVAYFEERLKDLVEDGRVVVMQ